MTFRHIGYSETIERGRVAVLYVPGVHNLRPETIGVCAPDLESNCIDGFPNGTRVAPSALVCMGLAIVHGRPIPDWCASMPFEPVPFTPVA